jgi:ABC-type multidrug transport system fused ATPase/permease subunit
MSTAVAALRTKGAYGLWEYVPRAFPYLRPYRGAMGFSIFLSFVTAFVHLLQPWPLAIMIDSVLGDRPLPPIASEILPTGNDYLLLGILVAAGFLLTVLGNALTVWQTFIDAKVEQSMILDFRSDLFQHCQQLSLTFHDARQTGELMGRINYAASSVGNVVMAFPPMLQSVLNLVGMLIVSILIDWRLALVSLVVVPFLYYSAGLYGKRVVPRLERVQSLEWQSLSIVHEAMAMLRVIVSFGREQYEFRRFREQGETAVDERVRLTVRQTVFTLIVNTITAAGTAVVFGYGFYLVLDGQLDAGRLLVVLAYVASIYQPLEAISSSINLLHTELVALRSSFQLLDTQPEVRDAPDAVELERVRGEVEYDNVSFSYKSRQNTLREISFHADPGQRVAIVGPTGAGKTTLVSLLARFYDPREGRILIDGIDLRKIKLRSLRDQIAVVLQEPLLFSGTVAANIRYGRLEASMEDVIDAARAAGAHDFIERLPQGYETELGERGAQLSGGERQRICVARAFIRDAPILILDEPTSSIDSKTEGIILDALERLMVGRTSFMIAHRLSTIRHADKIVVLDKGRVVEQGTHDELLGHEGLYRQLYEAQIRGRGRMPTTHRARMMSTLSEALTESDDEIARRVRDALGMQNGEDDEWEDPEKSDR